MRVRALLAVVLAVGGLAACTAAGAGTGAGPATASGSDGSNPSSRSGRGGSTQGPSAGAPLAGAAQPQAVQTPSVPARVGVVSTQAALQITTGYGGAAAAAARTRNVKATKAIQTGPQLILSLADYRYAKRSGTKPPAAVQLSQHGNLIPAAGGAHRWFISTGFSGDRGSDYVSLFEQARAGGPWRKSLEIWLGLREFPDAIITAGTADVVDRTWAARDTAAVNLVTRYLTTGRRSPRLASIDPAQEVRSYLREESTRLKGATSTLRCGRWPGATTAAVRTSDGSALVTALRCTLTQRAQAGWTLFLRNRWKGLADRTSGLHSLSVQFLVEVAVTVGRDGTTRVLGTTWGSVAVATH